MLPEGAKLLVPSARAVGEAVEAQLSPSSTSSSILALVIEVIAFARAVSGKFCEEVFPR
jgi:hypothetical protein